MGMVCRQRLLGDRAKQGRLARRQSWRRLNQRQAREDAKGRRLGRSQSGCRLFSLQVPLRDACFRQGGDRRQLNRQGWTRKGSNRQEDGEPRRKATAQLPTSTFSPAEKHPIVSCAADGPDDHGLRPATRDNDPCHRRLSSRVKGVEAGYPLPQGTPPILNRPVSPDLQSSRGRPSPAWHLGPSGLKIPPLEAFDAESAPLLATPMEVDLVRTKCHPQATVALDM
jgi:hypothetical protein